MTNFLKDVAIGVAKVCFGLFLAAWLSYLFSFDYAVAIGIIALTVAVSSHDRSADAKP